jgi:taurine dioxygenase
MVLTYYKAVSNLSANESGNVMLTINPLGDALGAEITGIKLGALDGGALEELKAALYTHGVLCIRDQNDLTPEHHVAFTKRMGDLHQHVLNQFTLADHPAVLVLSNETDDDGNLIGIKDGAQYWHTDISYEKEPLSFSILRAIKLPKKDGEILGDTMFASTSAAYEALPGDMKQRIKNLKSMHSYTTYTKARQGREAVRGKTTQEQKDKVPDNSHPIVRTHPETGRKCLYVNEGFSIKICDMPEAESRNLLDELFAHIKKPAFIYRHHWQPGDVLIWDNPQTQHCAVGDYGHYDPPLYRTMNRTAVKGSAPF